MRLPNATREPGYPTASMPTVPISRPTGRRLEVYIGRHCPNCDEALALADEAATRFPDLLVRVIDLDFEPGPPPESVVAVPTFVLDGRTISLGNPYPEELFARLHEGVG